MPDLESRIAALELLVEQLILERVQSTEAPEATVRAGMKRLTAIATRRPACRRGRSGLLL